MTNRNLYRIGLAAAILSTVGWLAYILGSTGSPDVSEIHGRMLFETYNDARSTYLLYGWGGIFGALLTIAYALSFHHATDNAGSVRTLTTVAIVIGAVLTSLGFMKSLTNIYYFVPAALEAGAAQMPQIEAAAKFAGYAFEVPWFLGSFLTYGLGAGLLSLHALRAKVGPKWVNIVGIVGGISGIIWLREFLPFLLPLTTIGSLINIVTISIWCIGLSTSLVRKVATN